MVPRVGPGGCRLTCGPCCVFQTQIGVKGFWRCFLVLFSYWMLSAFWEMLPKRQGVRDRTGVSRVQSTLPLKAHPHICCTSIPVSHS